MRLVGMGELTGFVENASDMADRSTGYTVIAGSAAGASNVFNGSVGLTNTVSASVTSGPYFIRVVANTACGSSAASNEVLVSVP